MPSDVPPATEVEILDETTVYRGHNDMQVYRLRHQKRDGSWSDVLSREVLRRRHAVAVLPYDPLRDRVVLTEQFRAGAYLGGINPWVTSVVAGLIEDGENPEEVAHREAQEEAGLALLALERIGRIILSPAVSTETTTLYCGRVDSRGVGGEHGLAEEGEHITVTAVPAEEAFARLLAGRIESASAVVALQWLQFHRARLRAAWA